MAERGGDGEDDAPLTEPVTIPCLFINGAAIEVTGHVMRLIGWSSMPDLGGETRERRIQVRLAMQVDGAPPLKGSLAEIVRRVR